MDVVDIKKLTKFQKKQVVSLVEKFNKDNKETIEDSFHVCPKYGKSHPKITVSDHENPKTSFYIQK